MRQLDDTIFVSGQLEPADITEAAARGVTMIVNNRPDGEQFGQPTSAALRAAAEQAGLAYRHIPVSGGVSPDQVAAMAEALGAASGPVLAFCAAGMRSTMLWALARAGEGADGDELVSKAAAAGYDLSGLRPHLG
jgi:uncharacterized protein (TIGR01244 family)